MAHPASKHETHKHEWSGTDRRRSPRIGWRIPVVATWNPPRALQSVTVREHGETLDVSAHGALVKLPSSLARGRQIKILRPGGKVFVSARVVRNLGPDCDGLTRLGLEVDTPGIESWVRMAY